MPANAMTKFDIFIGTWNTSGEVLETAAGSAGHLVATDTYRWLPGRHFIVHEVDARFDGKPARSMEVIGFDAANKRHFAHSYDDQGATDAFVKTLQGRKYAIEGRTVRFTGAFDAKGDRLQGLRELKAGKARWQPWIRLQLVRA